MPDRTGLYSLAGRTIVLLTRHGKERVIAPMLESALGCRVERVDGFDTDQLGEFILPCDAVRTAEDPDATLLSFLQSTYEAAANLAGWDRAMLEREPIAPKG
jgi:hypothetical protein